jgi:hypothetical protein
MIASVRTVNATILPMLTAPFVTVSDATRAGGPRQPWLNKTDNLLTTRDPCRGVPSTAASLQRAIPLALAQSAFKFPASFAPTDGDDIEIEPLVGIVGQQKSNRAQKLIADRFVAACFDYLQSSVMKVAAARCLQLIG